MNRVEDGIIYWTCCNCGCENSIEVLNLEVFSECYSCGNLHDVEVKDGIVLVEEF